MFFVSHACMLALCQLGMIYIYRLYCKATFPLYNYIDWTPQRASHLLPIIIGLCSYTPCTSTRSSEVNLGNMNSLTMAMKIKLCKGDFKFTSNTPKISPK